MKHLLLLFLYLIVCTEIQAQVGIGGKPHPSAALDVPSTDKAFYPPRMTSAQRKNIINPQPGAFVYDTDQGALYLFNGQIWQSVTVSSANYVTPLSFTATDGGSNSSFGAGVSIAGDYTIIGAPDAEIVNNGVTSTDQGAAYIFTRSTHGWSQQVKLVADDGAAGDHFGQAVAIYGDYAIVGAYQDDIGSNLNQGSVYIFIRNGTTWTQQAKLTASDGSANDLFGSKVALYGDYAIVSGGDDDITVNGVANTDQGSAFIYIRSGTTWTEQAKLIASDGASSTYFGNSVSIYGDYALVGAYNASILVNGATHEGQGATYVFIRNGTTWTEQAKLIASDGASSDRFGASVSINGDYALVGADQDDNSGSAYVFIRNGSTWMQQAKLTFSNSYYQSYFGGAVSLSGKYALIGAYKNDSSGNAFIFARDGTTWAYRRILNPTATGGSYGTSISIDHETYIIGAPSFQNNTGQVAISTFDNL
ncbi:FG-GAP repeat protein [Spirosoma endophyticum]|uniref:FG-GAP repeat-containing protein n=1 Tax=Spirosoma endophyticum TaxID=662367 RepID=A0A1I2DH80_9BACT|nr:FG-GAP repeat protein [Spirosoma endophyticum]SFE79874.1 FG-GAP repeat-containing protein [Spirosoma endophyticum]